MKQPDLIAKTKARDIIPGWPRGRSTGGLGTWSGDEMSGTRHWFLFCRATSDDAGDRHLEYDRAMLYHARQQDMLYEYIERYRRLTQHGECLLDPGYYIDLFGRRSKIIMPLRLFRKD